MKYDIQAKSNGIIIPEPPVGTDITWDRDRAAMKRRNSRNSPLPSVRMISPAGNPVDVAYGNRNISRHQLAVYKQQKVNEKLAKGFLLYDDFTSDKKREDEISRRQAKHKDKQDAMRRQSMTEGRLMVEAVKHLAAQNTPAE